MSGQTFDPDRTTGTLAPEDERSDDDAGSLPRWRVGPGGEFVPGDRLGEGGMSVVVRAVQRFPQRSVALKRPRGVRRSAEIRGLLREAEVTAQVEHPNVVPVHAIGQDEAGDPVVVLRELSGRTLASSPRPTDAAGWRALASTVVAVCRALEAAHHRGWIHCDVKTTNVLVGEFGETWLVDWGIAQRSGTAAGYVRGTPGYFAPEQARGAAVDARTDVYLLGALLHHLLTGRMRHEAADLEGYARAAERSVTTDWPADAPAELGALADRCCRADPAERPADVAEVRRAIAAWIGASHFDGLVEAAWVQLRRPASDPVADRARWVQVRFALAQAAETGNRRAVDGLCEALDALIGADLADGDVVSARSWVAGHPRWDAAREARVVAREQELRDQADARERRERDRDLGGQRSGLVVQLLAMGASVGVVAVVATSVQVLGWVTDVAAVRVVVALVLLAVYGAGRWYAIARRDPGLLARRLLDGGLAYLALLLLSRVVVGLWMRAPVPVATASDLVTTAAWSIGWWTVFRSAPAVLFASVVLLLFQAVNPDHGGMVLNLQVAAIVGVLSFELVRDEFAAAGRAGSG